MEKFVVDTYKVQSLKRRLMQHYGEKAHLHQQHEKNKSDLICRSSTNLSDIIHLVAELNEGTKDSRNAPAVAVKWRVPLKLNYRTRIACKNNPQYWSLSTSKRPKDCMSTNIFNIAWFSDCFSYKKRLPAIETSVISGLDITLAVRWKNSFDSLDERRRHRTSSRCWRSDDLSKEN